MKRIFFLLFLLLLINCKQKQTDPKWVDPNTIQQGPILHDSLNVEQLKSIDYLYNTFKEVDPTTKENWITDFKRDLNPDNEIDIWMNMAKVYNSFCNGKGLSIEIKKEVFKIVLVRSSAPENDVLNNLKLEYLTQEDAMSIMKNYTIVAKPLTIYKE